jgi:hypothetical protein
MFAQNMPCKSSGSKLMDWTMASPNPAWCNPKGVKRHFQQAQCFAKGARTYMLWAKHYFGNREAFVAHIKNLLALNRQVVTLAYVSVSIPGKIRKHVFLYNRISTLINPESGDGISRADATRPDGTREPAGFEIGNKLRRDIATLLLDVIHDVCFLHHVPLPERDKFLEMICQELSANIYSGINS